MNILLKDKIFFLVAVKVELTVLNEIRPDDCFEKSETFA
jgi:hypothetical protein